jgi:hypothetical protein
MSSEVRFKDLFVSTRGDSGHTNVPRYLCHR